MKYRGNQFTEIHIKWTHLEGWRSAAHLAPCFLVAKVSIMHPNTTSLLLLPSRPSSALQGQCRLPCPHMCRYGCLYASQLAIITHFFLFQKGVGAYCFLRGRGLLFSHLSFLFTLKSSISSLLSFTCLWRFLQVFGNVPYRNMCQPVNDFHLFVLICF